MWQQTLKQKLDAANIDPRAYSLTGDSGETLWSITKHPDGTFETFFTERGTKLYAKTFPTEQPACADFLNTLIKEFAHITRAPHPPKP